MGVKKGVKRGVKKAMLASLDLWSLARQELPFLLPFIQVSSSAQPMP
jgi:hypothetical protein